MTSIWTSRREHFRHQQVQWQLGGLQTDASWPKPGVWYAPELLSLSGDYLYWEHPGRKVRPDDEILAGFMSLSEGAERRILSFARRYGVIEVCAHDLPASHKPRCQPQVGSAELEEQVANPKPRPFGKPYSLTHREPIAVWRKFATLFSALSNISATLRMREPSRDLDWVVVRDSLDLQEGGLFTAKFKGSRLEHDKHRLAAVFNLLIATAGIRPYIEVAGGGWDMMFGGRWSIASGLFGELVFRLVLACTGVETPIRCSGCARPFLPTRKPAVGRRSYCKSCRKKGRPLRDAKRAQRDRLRSSSRPPASVQV